jgi:hypothetical protein
MEESTFTDNDSLQSQLQPSYNSKNVTEIANEWNTTTSLSEGESPSKTSTGKSVSKSFKRLKKNISRQQNTKSSKQLQMKNQFLTLTW